MSLLSRLTASSRRKVEDEPKPDISRVVGGWQNDRKAAEAEESGSENLSDWLRSDLSQLTDTMTAAIAHPEDADARTAFETAIHNLYGASGAYGGGALTRLTGSLQKLVGNTEDLKSVAALINLHVQACLAVVRGGDQNGESVSDAVCDALENQVVAKLAANAAANW